MSKKLSFRSIGSALSFPPLALLLVTTSFPSYADFKMEEIVVTAQKREQSLTDIPMTINAFRGDQLEGFGSKDLSDLADIVPSLSVASTQGSNSLYRFYLRGLGTDGFHYNDAAPVGVYTDGVYNGSPAQFGYQFMDVDRLEVLKGPQGTLYGRNTTAGAINLISKKPVINGETDGYMILGAGNYGTYRLEAAGNLSLGDSLAVRIAAKNETSDGVFEAIGPGYTDDDLGESENSSIRATFLLEATDNLTAELGVYYGESDGEPRPTHAVGLFDGPFSFVPCASPSLSNDTGCTTAIGFTPLNDDLHEATIQFSGIDDTEGSGLRLQLDYSFDGMNLVSITSYDKAEATASADSDGLLLNAYLSTFAVDFDSFQQELRLVSTTEGRLRWTAGVSYFESTSDQFEAFNQADYHFLSGNSGDIASFVDQETVTYGVFGEFYYDLTDQLELTVGLRLTHDERSASGEMFVVDPVFNQANVGPVTPAQARANIIPDPADITVLDPVTFFPVSAGLTSPYLLVPGSKASDEWDEWSGRLALNYNLSSGNSVYASVSRGFKGGEIDGGAVNLDDLQPTDPEYITAYEIGARTLFSEGRVELNVAAFYYDFTDQQISTTNIDFTQLADFTDLSNAGESTIKGIEFAATFIPAANLQLIFQGAYLDARYDEFFDIAAAVDRSGNDMTNAPGTDFSAVASYLIPFQNGSSLTLQLDTTFEDERYFTVVNDPAISQDDSFWKVGGIITYMSSDEKWEVSLWGRNLTDEEYVTTGYDGYFLGGVAILNPGDPRTYGMTATMRF